MMVDRNPGRDVSGVLLFAKKYQSEMFRSILEPESLWFRRTLHGNT
jgi:hypothetical protein